MIAYPRQRRSHMARLGIVCCMAVAMSTAAIASALAVAQQVGGMRIGPNLLLYPTFAPDSMTGDPGAQYWSIVVGGMTKCNSEKLADDSLEALRPEISVVVNGQAVFGVDTNDAEPATTGVFRATDGTYLIATQALQSYGEDVAISVQCRGEGDGFIDVGRGSFSAQTHENVPAFETAPVVRDGHIAVGDISSFYANQAVDITTIRASIDGRRAEIAPIEPPGYAEITIPSDAAVGLHLLEIESAGQTLLAPFVLPAEEAGGASTGSGSDAASERTAIASPPPVEQPSATSTEQPVGEADNSSATSLEAEPASRTAPLWTIAVMGVMAFAIIMLSLGVFVLWSRDG